MRDNDKKMQLMKEDIKEYLAKIYQLETLNQQLESTAQTHRLQASVHMGKTSNTLPDQ
jgi:hypothetical protein